MSGRRRGRGPVAVRRSKAIGIIAYQARLRDLLARHAHDADPHQTPEERVAAHRADPTDPWAADLPAAGWETDRHGNVHQPSFDDVDDDCWTSQQPGSGSDDSEPWSEEPPVDDGDLAWYQRQRHADSAGGSPADGEHPSDSDAASAATPTPDVPAAVRPAALLVRRRVPGSICGRSPRPSRAVDPVW